MSRKSNIKKGLLQVGTALQAVALLGAGAVTMVGISSPASAQDYTRGNLVGTLTNEDGTPIAGGKVTVTSNEQGFSNTTTTSSDGVFRIPALPTGTYNVVIEVDGAVVVEDRSATVVAGSSTNYQYSTAAAAGDNAIVVTGSRIVTNDFSRLTTGITLNVQEVAESIPVSRSQTGLILLAPGTTPGDTGFADCADCVSFGGASIAENSYYVNGLNTTNFRTFVGNNAVPFEFYRTFDVKTGAWSAEYGRALGGVTSAVTKSGSNDFETGFVVSYAPDWLTAKAPNTFTDPDGVGLKSRNSQDYRETLDANIYASGALVKDRLFFYGLFSPRSVRQYDTSVTQGYRFRSQSDTPFYGGKIDAIITDGHRLEGTYWSDKRTINTDYLNVDDNGVTTGGVEGREVNKIGGSNWIAQYTGQFTDFFTLSAAYGVNKYRRIDVVGGGDTAGPIVQSTLTGSTTVISGIPLAPSSGRDKREVFRVDADLYFNLAGAHHVRVGFDREDLSVTENTFYTGEYIYRYTPGYIRARHYQNLGFFETQQTAFYIQDSWDVFDERLNLQLGLRNDQFENFSITGQKYLNLKNQWAPRLGASFDVFGDKLTKINAFWGRYYLPVATNTNIRLGGAETFYEQRFAYPAGVDSGNFDSRGAPVGQPVTSSGAPVLGALTSANTQPCPNFGPGAGQLCRSIFSDGRPGPTDTLVAENLDPMYQEEFIFGVQHKVSDYTFGLRYTRRRLKETLEDVAIDAAVLDYCDANGVTGCDDVFTGFHQYVLANPGKDITVRLDGDCDVDPQQCEVVTLSADDLGYPRASRKYDSVEFTVNKAFNGLWGLDFSYTWQKLRGNYEGSVKSDNNQDDAGLTQDFDQPGLVDGAYGHLANERKHTFKLFGSLQPVDWLRIGANFTVAAPRKYSCIGVHPTDFFASIYGAASFYCSNPEGNGGSTNSELVPRGSAFKGEWFKNLDIGFQFKMPEALGNSSLRIDVFNVFNWETKTDYVEFGEFDSGNIRDDYRLPTGYQAPRSLRLTWTSRFGGKN